MEISCRKNKKTGTALANIVPIKIKNNGSKIDLATFLIIGIYKVNITNNESKYNQ